MKQECYALYLASKHPGTPWYAKLIIVITLAYLLSPIDLIPDFIPVVGYLDDLLIVPFLIALSIRLIPKDIMVECRKKAGESQVQLRKKWAGMIVILIIWIVLVGIFIKWLLHKMKH